ncbi:hypothetical protein ACFFX0_13165 [Citricoccus parietis]|uniref:Uncharacterized protein n=1 Tax=Citricoccus parietis TaxID=592307 RepID=A0ABV5FZK6_9MICC
MSALAPGGRHDGAGEDQRADGGGHGQVVDHLGHRQSPTGQGPGVGELVHGQDARPGGGQHQGDRADDAGHGPQPHRRGGAPLSGWGRFHSIHSLAGGSCRWRPGAEVPRAARCNAVALQSGALAGQRPLVPESFDPPSGPLVPSSPSIPSVPSVPLPVPP